MTEPQQPPSAQPSAARQPSASSFGRPSTSKRVSTVAAPKAPTSVHSTALIAGHAVLTGTNLITVGPRAVVHPYARINSTNGPIILGEASVIWEGAVIGAPSGDKSSVPSDSTKKETDAGQGVDLGRYVVVECGAVVEAASIGEGTLIEADAKIGKGAVVGKVCANLTPDLQGLRNTYPSSKNEPLEDCAAECLG